VEYEAFIAVIFFALYGVHTVWLAFIHRWTTLYLSVEIEY